MPAEIIMPKLGMTMTEGTVVEWFKKENDPVQKGEPICEISSEKLQNEVEAPADGIILKIVIQENETVPVATPIGYIGQPGEKIMSDQVKVEVPKTSDQEVATTMEPATQPNPIRTTRIRISPAARKLAQSLNIDIETIKGTGPNGRITNADVEQAAKEHTLAAASIEKENPEYKNAPQIKKMIGMRKAVADHMYKSMKETAQLTLMLKADVTDLRDLRNKIKSQAGDETNVKVTLTHFIAKAVIRALLIHKNMNSTYENGDIHLHEEVHLGIAVALEEGLIVPVLRHAENMSLAEIAKQIQTLSQKARQGELTEFEMKGSTFTITNLGRSGTEYFTPVLNYPETGILGVGTLQPTAVFTDDDNIIRRDLLPLSLTFDHRILDGAPASEFLATVKDNLEKPYSLLL